jgi:hypothetical protein
MEVYENLPEYFFTIRFLNRPRRPGSFSHGGGTRVCVKWIVCKGSWVSKELSSVIQDLVSVIVRAGRNKYPLWRTVC